MRQRGRVPSSCLVGLVFWTLQREGLHLRESRFGRRVRPGAGREAHRGRRLDVCRLERGCTPRRGVAGSSRGRPVRVRKWDVVVESRFPSTRTRPSNRRRAATPRCGPPGDGHAVVARRAAVGAGCRRSRLVLTRSRSPVPRALVVFRHSGRELLPGRLPSPSLVFSPAIDSSSCCSDSTGSDGPALGQT